MPQEEVLIGMRLTKAISYKRALFSFMKEESFYENLKFVHRPKDRKRKTLQAYIIKNGEEDPEYYMPAHVPTESPHYKFSQRSSIEFFRGRDATNPWTSKFPQLLFEKLLRRKQKGKLIHENDRASGTSIRRFYTYDDELEAPSNPAPVVYRRLSTQPPVLDNPDWFATKSKFIGVIFNGQTYMSSISKEKMKANSNYSWRCSNRKCHGSISMTGLDIGTVKETEKHKHAEPVSFNFSWAI